MRKAHIGESKGQNRQNDEGNQRQHKKTCAATRMPEHPASACCVRRRSVDRRHLGNWRVLPALCAPSPVWRWMSGIVMAQRSTSETAPPRLQLTFARLRNIR